MTGDVLHWMRHRQQPSSRLHNHLFCHLYRNNMSLCSMRVSVIEADAARNGEIAGSNPIRATKKLSRQDDFHSRPVFVQFLPPILLHGEFISSVTR